MMLEGSVRSGYGRLFALAQAAFSAGLSEEMPNTWAPLSWNLRVTDV